MTNSGLMIRKIRSKINDNIQLKELVSSSTVFLLLRIFGIGCGYLFTLMITRNCGASAMGIFTLSFILLQMASVVGRFGLDTALLRFVSELASKGLQNDARAVYMKSFLFALCLSVLLSFSVYIFAPWVSVSVFNKACLRKAFELVSLAVAPLALLYLNFETLRGLKKIREYAFLQNTSTFLIASVLLAFFLDANNNNLFPVKVFVIAVYFTFGLSMFQISKSLGFTFSFLNGAPRLSPVLKVAFPMLISSSLMLFMGWTDSIMIGIYMDEQYVGIYSVALKVAATAGITLMAVNSIAAPRFAEYYSKKDMVSFQKIICYSSRLIFWTSLPVLIICLVFPSQIMRLFGSEFTTGKYALMILTIGQFVNAVSGSVGYILQMTGKEIVFQNIVTASVMLNIILNIILIPLFGITGAAVASAASMIFWNAVSAVYIVKSEKIITVYLPFSRGRK